MEAQLYQQVKLDEHKHAQRFNSIRHWGSIIVYTVFLIVLNCGILVWSWNTFAPNNLRFLTPAEIQNIELLGKGILFGWVINEIRSKVEERK